MYMIRFMRLATGRNPTVELRRRRESKHPPPHQVSYKTRPRRSRPTICWIAPLGKAISSVQDESAPHSARTHEYHGGRELLEAGNYFRPRPPTLEPRLCPIARSAETRRVRGVC